MNNGLWMCVCVPQRRRGNSANILSKPGMQSGGEEEQDEEAHTDLPPRMEIIKDQEDKVREDGVHGTKYMLYPTSYLSHRSNL